MVRMHEPLAQCAAAILMVRPAAFGFNQETAGTNLFQSPPAAGPESVRREALSEFDTAVESLRRAGVEVLVADEGTDPVSPDAIFPNNWISTHHDGTVVLYPMLAPVRRLERRADIVDRLSTGWGFGVRRVIDLGSNETCGRYLEGTGSIVFDHTNRTAYASLSPRSHRGMLYETQALLDYEFVVFRASDASGAAVYHTNVVMAIGERFAVVSAEAIGDERERQEVLGSLGSTGREILEITRAQMASFAGNVLELRSTRDEPVLAASERAWRAFSEEQRRTLGTLARVVAVPMPTIESVGGGSMRCMIAEIFLPRPGLR